MYACQYGTMARPGSTVAPAKQCVLCWHVALTARNWLFLPTGKADEFYIVATGTLWACY